MKNMIEIKNLVMSYQKHIVLEQVCLNIPKGSMMAIVGPNGAGKSTLLKGILGLLKPTSGEIQFNEIKKEDIAYVPQKSSVKWNFPITVFDTVLMGQYPYLGKIKFYTKKHKLIAKDALLKTNMWEYRNHHIQQLSGGQKQRVFLARALCQNPEIYILDEPLAGIDAKSEKEIIQYLQQLYSQGKTIICVHHDLNTLPLYFKSTLFLNKTVIAYGETEKIMQNEIIRKTYSEVKNE